MAYVYGRGIERNAFAPVDPMRLSIAVASVVLLGLCPPQALAQLILPGALPAPPAAAATGKKAAPGKDGIAGPDVAARRKPAAVAVKAAGEDGLLGRELHLNGKSGRIGFARDGSDLAVSFLTLEGLQISHPDDACRVDVVAGKPLAAKAVGKPQGSPRFQVALEACPFAFDVLEGAILVPAMPQICEIKAADCRVDPAGLWGPRGASISPERAKEIEKARTHAETAMRENFKALLANASGKAATKATAGDQAGFSSARSIICRDYAREDKHGFCSLRVTEARSLALRAATGQVQDEAAAVRKARRR